MDMFDHVHDKYNSLIMLERQRASNIDEACLPWIHYNVGNASWSYFEIAKASPSQFTWHVGTYEDFTSFLLMPSAEARYEYAKANCKAVKVIGGVVCL